LAKHIFVTGGVASSLGKGLTASSLGRLLKSRGLRVTIEDSSARLAVAALQGPRSREILRTALGSDGADIDRLKFFGATRARVDGLDVWVTRTGYTGDLGYEVWADKDGALRLWDALLDAGRPHGIEPAGLDALDVAGLMTVGRLSESPEAARPTFAGLRRLSEEPMVVALPKRHSAAGLQEVDLAMLKDDPFLLFPREVAPTVYDTVVDACRKAGFEPIIGQVAPHFTSIVNLVAAELGVSIVPASMMQVRVTGIVYRQIAGQSPTTRLALAYRRGETSPVVRNFIARAGS